MTGNPKLPSNNSTLVGNARQGLTSGLGWNTRLSGERLFLSLMALGYDNVHTW